MSRITNPILNQQVGNLTSDQAPERVSSAVRSLITMGFIIGSLIFFFMLIIGGIHYISAGGDKEQVQKASKTILTALIGLVILFSVYAIVSLLSSFFGVDLLLLQIPSLNIP